MATLFSYLENRNTPVRCQQQRTVNTISYRRRRVFSFVFEHWQQRTKLVLRKGSWMYTDGKLLLWHIPTQSCSETYWCLLIFSGIYRHFWRRWRLSAHLIQGNHKQNMQAADLARKIVKLGIRILIKLQSLSIPSIIECHPIKPFPHKIPKSYLQKVMTHTICLNIHAMFSNHCLFPGFAITTLSPTCSLQQTLDALPYAVIYICAK